MCLTRPTLARPTGLRHVYTCVPYSAAPLVCCHAPQEVRMESCVARNRLVTCGLSHVGFHMRTTSPIYDTLKCVQRTPRTHACQHSRFQASWPFRPNQQRRAPGMLVHALLPSRRHLSGAPAWRTWAVVQAWRRCVQRAWRRFLPSPLRCKG